ncbi:hypothetical protein [Priestia taiwanensis]|uniref:Uncharacterized protein n=1 Tax=Priestia taiwanensis TaxID=1347902 RepID=A0A917ERN6_9BACI|nr:hypothetical protein [Priestia taiwanensis]MBM7364097.1 hypothetical protein [Priestia taiwanensis]GGE71581.1 hypothetical protein GCM10007140_21900 [Priestia taiwanensis]
MNLTEIFDDLCGAVILDIHIDMLNDAITMKLKIVEDDQIRNHEVVFLDVASYYYTKNEQNHRYDFYDSEQVNYLEVTTVEQLYPLGKVKLHIPDNEEWSEWYGTDVNIMLEIWNAILCIDARRISFDGELFELKPKAEFELTTDTEMEGYARFVHYTDVYCATLLGEGQHSHFNDCMSLFQGRMNKLIVAGNADVSQTLERERVERCIPYKVVHGYTIFEAVTPEQEEYIAELFYSIGSINTWAVLCIGEGVEIEFEKIKRKKLVEYIFGERWEPTFRLKPGTACAFLRYDGADLMLVENEFEMGDVKDGELDSVNGKRV